MAFSGSGIAEHQQVLPALEQASIQQHIHLSADLGRQALGLEVGQRFFERQAGFSEQYANPLLPPLFALFLRQLRQVLLITEGFLFRPPSAFIEAFTDGGEMQNPEIVFQGRLYPSQAAHAGTSLQSSSKTLRSTAATVTARKGSLPSTVSAFSTASSVAVSPLSTRTWSAWSTLFAPT